MWPECTEADESWRAGGCQLTVWMGTSQVSLIYNNTFLDLREEDNLSIVDKMAGPKVFFISY